MIQLQLHLRPDPKAAYPIQGVLLHQSGPMAWLQALQALGVDPMEVDCYPIPGTQPGQIWGAVIWLPAPVPALPFSYQGLHLIHDCLLVPPQTTLFPAVDGPTLQQLLLDKRHLLHPTLGLVELFEPIQWTALIQPPPLQAFQVQAPSPGIVVPQQLYTLSVSAATIQESLAQLDQAALPPEHQTPKKPLNESEKQRLKQLRHWRQAHKNPPQGWLQRLWQKAQRHPDWTPELEAEWKGLEERNPPNSDQLLDLLKNDPEKGLVYAPPLSQEGSLGRGSGATTASGNWSWVPRWLSDSMEEWQRQGHRESGRHQSAVVSDEWYSRLSIQYEQTAQLLAEQGKYAKAAFVYLRLLRRPKQAVDLLEKGGLYAEAASVCLEYLHDQRRAAENAVRAHQWALALQLYQALDDPLPLAQVYERLHQPELALAQYERFLQNLLAVYDFAEAGHFALTQLQDPERAKAIYLQGWQKRRDAEHCLKAYLALLPDAPARQQALLEIYEKEVSTPHVLPYLRLLLQYKKKEALPQPWLQAQAYRVVADYLPEIPQLARQLLYWHPDDRHLGKDVLRYRRQERQRKKQQ